jgi:hypothetical protein
MERELDVRIARMRVQNDSRTGPTALHLTILAPLAHRARPLSHDARCKIMAHTQTESSIDFQRKLCYNVAKYSNFT